MDNTPELQPELQLDLATRALAAKVRRLMEATGCTVETAEESLYRHKGEYDAALTEITEEQPDEDADADEDGVYAEPYQCSACGQEGYGPDFWEHERRCRREEDYRAQEEEAAREAERQEAEIREDYQRSREEDMWWS